MVNYTKSDPSGRVTKQTRREMQMERGCEIARQMGFPRRLSLGSHLEGVLADVGDPRVFVALEEPADVTGELPLRSFFHRETHFQQ